MSEKSFAIVSISAAIVCGTFFYPPPPAEAVPAPVIEQAVAPLPLKKPVPVHAPGEQRAVEQLAKLGSVAAPDMQHWGQRLQAGK